MSSIHAAMIASANADPAFPCVVRLHREDPCKNALIEIHSAWSLEYRPAVEDHDGAELAAGELVARFVAIGAKTLGNPETRVDCRIRLMGNSGDWAMYELTSMTDAEIHQAVDRFEAAFGHRVERLIAAA